MNLTARDWRRLASFYANVFGCSIVPPGTSFPPGSNDLQAWMRNTALDPDWLRVGTDIVGGNPAPTFNASFTLSGQTVPEPSSLTLLVLGAAAMAGVVRVRRQRRPSSY